MLHLITTTSIRIIIMYYTLDPGFAGRMRELTQLQSQLQYQIETHGSHIFKEGALVVPNNIIFFFFF